MSPAADRNLLFGILALQMDFITRDQLVAGMHAWVLEKTKPLGEVLRQHGVLGPERQQLLDALVAEHLKQHNNDPQQSLASLNSPSPWLGEAPGAGRSLRKDLEQLADADVQASLLHLPTPRDESSNPAGQPLTISYHPAAGARFRILRPHAEGGLGKVSVALDEELNREVALKEIKDLHADNTDSRGRFLLEAEITGGLEHPGIVPVYSLGTYADGRPFYAMRFIKGDSLKDAIARFHNSITAENAEIRRDNSLRPSAFSAVDFSGLNFRQLLGRFIDVCNAIAYAHSRGVLHRDLKPGNIMLGRYGETLVVDWGLAKAVGRAESLERPGDAEPTLKPTSGSSDQTIPGSALGTPAYMSPEQAAGRLDLLGPASDVYSLGATLYQVLTGQPAFAEPDIAAILHKVRRGDFVPPRQRNPQIPAALEAICMKAMALEPQNRYAAAKDLADDIEHWLADEPVSAFGEPWPVRAGRLARKHKTLVAGAAAALLVGVISLLAANVVLNQANENLAAKEKETREANEATQVVNVKLEKEKQAAEEARQQAENSDKRSKALAIAEKTARDQAQKSAKKASDRADQIEDNLATSTMQLARSRFEENNTGLAEELLEQVPDEYRMSPWRNLKNYVAGSLYTLRGHTSGITSVTFSPDGQVVASGSADNTVKLWDARTGQEIRTLRGHTNRVGSVTFSPDGKVVASGSDDKTVKLWDARDGQEICAFRGHAVGVSSVAFSPDGQVVVSGSRVGPVKLWDARTGQELRALQAQKGFVNSVAFSPDGQTVAVGSDETITLWDAHTGQVIRDLRGHTARVTSVTFNPDGQVIASGSHDTTMKLWDTRTGKEIRALRAHAYFVTSATFSPDGQLVALGSHDTTVRLWDARTGQEIRALRGHTAAVTSVTFSPDGQLVASGSSDGTVKLWNAGNDQEIRAFRGHTAEVTSVTFNPDGQTVAAGSMDGTAEVTSVTFSPDGQTVASGSMDGTVKLCDARTGQVIRSLRGHTATEFDMSNPAAGIISGAWRTDGTGKVWSLRPGTVTVSSVTFSPDGQVIASGSWDKTVKLWNVRTGLALRGLRGHTGHVNSVTFSPDGQLVASGSSDNTVRLWDARTGQEIRSLRAHTASVTSVMFSPDGQFIASGSLDRSVRLWEAHTGKEIRALRGHTGSVESVTFSPDSQLVASGSEDHTVKLWEPRTGKQIRALRGHSSRITSVTFSPDGQIVASGSRDNTVKLWDARTGQEIRVLRGHTNGVSSVTFRPDGQAVASGSYDGTVKLWDARTRQEIRAFRGHTYEVFSVMFSPDNQVVASGSGDRTVRLWDIRTGREIRTLRGHVNWVNCVTFSPDGQVVASGSGDKTVKLWDSGTGKEIRTLYGHTLGVNSLRFSPDGLTIASGSFDKTVKLWDSRTGQIIRTLRGNMKQVTSMIFSPNATVIYAFDITGNRFAWQTATGTQVPVASIQFPETGATAWSADHQLLASAGPGGLIYLISNSLSDAEMRFRITATLPDPAEHRHHALQADEAKQPFAAACRLGHAIMARRLLQLLPWDPAGSVHVVANGSTPVAALAGHAGLLDGRKAQTAFVDGATYAGILLKDSGRSAKGLVVRAQWAVDQWPQGWQNCEVLGAALYRDGDYQGAVRELTQSQKLRTAAGSSGNGRASIFSCHFLALAHHKLGNANDAARWQIKAVLPKDANWEDAMIDRYLRREVEAELSSK